MRRENLLFGVSNVTHVDLGHVMEMEMMTHWSRLFENVLFERKAPSSPSFSAPVFLLLHPPLPDVILSQSAPQTSSFYLRFKKKKLVWAVHFFWLVRYTLTHTNTYSTTLFSLCNREVKYCLFKFKDKLATLQLKMMMHLIFV